MAFDQFLRDLPGAHFRLFVIGGDVTRRRHQFPVFKRKRRLFSAIKKEGHMGILFGLCDPNCLMPLAAQHLSQDVREPDGAKATGRSNVSS